MIYSHVSIQAAFKRALELEGVTVPPGPSWECDTRIKSRAVAAVAAQLCIASEAVEEALQSETLHE